MGRKDSYRLALVLCLVPVCGMPVGSAWADMTLKERITDRSGRPIEERMTFYAPGKARIDGVGFTVISDLGKTRKYYVDHKKKMYVEIDLQVTKASARSAQREIDKYMGKSQRESFYNRAREEDTLQIIPTRETRTINRFPAQKVEVHKQGHPFLEMWYSSKIAGRDFRAFMEQATALSQGGSGHPSEGVMIFEATKDLGYPVLIRDLRSGSTREVVEVAEAKHPESLFLVPPGYRRVRYDELFADR